MDNVRLTRGQLDAILDALRRGDRVEIIPVKDGVRIMVVRRREIRA